MCRAFVTESKKFVIGGIVFAGRDTNLRQKGLQERGTIQGPACQRYRAAHSDKAKTTNPNERKNRYKVGFYVVQRSRSGVRLIDTTTSDYGRWVVGLSN
jgi:hypothetical protein